MLAAFLPDMRGKDKTPGIQTLVAAARQIQVSPEEVAAMAPGEVRELVVGSLLYTIPSVRLLRLGSEADLHDHQGRVTLVRVVAGRLREVAYTVTPPRWDRYVGGVPDDVSAVDFETEAVFLAAFIHQALALVKPTAILEVSWPPLTHSLRYRARTRNKAITYELVGEWFSSPENKRRFAGLED